MDRLGADFLLLLAAFFYGTSFLGQKDAVGGLNALTLVGARFSVAILLIAPLVWREARRAAAPLTRHDWQQVAAIGLCVLAGASLEQQGLVTTSITNAGFLTSLYVVMVPFLVWSLARQAPRPLVLLACAVCVSGAWLLAQHGVMQHWTLGDIQVVLADFFWAASITLIDLFLRRTARPFFLTFATYALTAVLGLGLGFASAPIALTAVTAAAPGILYAGLCGGIAGSLQIVAQKHTPAAEAGLIMALQSVFAALAGAWFLQERLTPAATLGCGLILLGVVLVEAGPALVQGLRRAVTRSH
jgi:drug/metabolite transporter (DMT)-like permease